MSGVDRKRILKTFVFLGALFVLTGCLRKVEVVTRERVDQRLEGNRGILQGAVPKTPSKASSTRDYVEWDIEVPTYEVAVRVPEWHREWHDKELWGNRGFMMGGPAQRRPRKEEAAPMKEIQRSVTPSFHRTVVAPPEEKEWEEKEEKAAPSYTRYTVKKGDTLGEISSKVYGTSKAWHRIYEANRDSLKDPNHLKPGQVLRIPPSEQKGKVSSSHQGTIK